MGYNWTLNENGNIVFPIPEAVKTPWFRSTGEIPHTCEYFNGTMYEKIEETAKKHPLNIAMDFMGKHITYKSILFPRKRRSRTISICRGASWS